MGDVEGYDGDFAFVVDKDAGFGHGDGVFGGFDRSMGVRGFLL